jgi:hypothetical protein
VIFQGKSSLLSAFPDTDEDESCGEWTSNLVVMAEHMDDLWAETAASAPPARGQKPIVEAAGPNWSIEQVHSLGTWQVHYDCEGVQTGFRTFDAARDYVMQRLRSHKPPQPVAYCIQCDPGDPKVHSLSFDSASLKRIVTKHGGKIVGLNLREPPA